MVCKFPNKLKYNSCLAEIIGIMLGDGCLYLDYRNKYHTIVCFHKYETDYMGYVKYLFESYFKDYKFSISEQKSEFLLRNVSVFVGEQLIYAGLKTGNKIKNRVSSPIWIFKNNLFLIRFLRGIFDTDGCIYRKYGKYLQIQFKFASIFILNSVRKALLNLGYHPTVIQKSLNNERFYEWKIYLSRQQEIHNFFLQVKPKNNKHLLRYMVMVKMGTLGLSE